MSLGLLVYLLLVFGHFRAGTRHAYRHNRPAQPGDPTAFEWHLVDHSDDRTAEPAERLRPAHGGIGPPPRPRPTSTTSPRTGTPATRGRR